MPTYNVYLPGETDSTGWTMKRIRKTAKTTVATDNLSVGTAPFLSTLGTAVAHDAECYVEIYKDGLHITQGEVAVGATDVVGPGSIAQSAIQTDASNTLAETKKIHRAASEVQAGGSVRKQLSSGKYIDETVTGDTP